MCVCVCVFGSGRHGRVTSPPLAPNLSPGVFSDYTGFFGLYDGHGGTTTSEFLADKLHENVYAKGLTTSDMEATRQKIVEAFAEVSRAPLLCVCVCV